MKLENIPLDTPLTVTINPSDKLQYFGKPGRICSVHKRMLKVFNQMRYWCSFWVVPEYSFNPQSSKMGSGPRLHYHGVLKITDLDYFLELGYTLLKDVAMFEIDTIEDMEKWQGYVMKSESIIRPMFEKRELPYKIDSSKLVVAGVKPVRDPIDFFPRE